MRSYRFQPPLTVASPRAPQGLRRLRSIAGSPRLVALMVAGSGILNLVSLQTAGPPPPPWLHGFIANNFVPVSDVLTLISSLALVLSAHHLWNNRGRAVHLSLALAGVSALLHFIQCPPVEEATGSAIVAIGLWAIW